MNKREKILQIMQRPSVRRTSIVLLSFMVVAFYSVLALNLKFLSPIGNVMRDFSMTDIYYQILWQTSSPDTSSVVTIVDLTDTYYRGEIAKNIRHIEKYHPKVLGVDAVFDGDRDDLQANMDLIEAISAHDNIVCSYILNHYVNDSVGYVASSNKHSFLAEMIPVHEGFTNIPRELYGGVKREVSLAERVDGNICQSFALEVCNGYIDQPEKRLKAEPRKVPINFSPKKFNVIKPADIDRHPELIEGRIVLYGSINEEGDKHYTPIGKIAGVELLAYAIETIITQSEVVPIEGWLHYLISFVLVYIFIFIEDKFLARTDRSGNPFVKHFLGSNYVVGIIIFFASVVFVGLGFILFGLTHISISLTLPLAASAFLGASKSFYTACKQSVSSTTKNIAATHDQDNTIDSMHRHDDFAESLGAETDSLPDFG